MNLNFIIYVPNEVRIINNFCMQCAFTSIYNIHYWCIFWYLEFQQQIETKWLTIYLSIARLLINMPGQIPDSI